MNPSEIAERAARREKFSAWYKANYLKIAGVSSWVERAWAAYEAGAIEESRGQPLVIGEPCPTCGCKYLGEMGDGDYSCVCGFGMQEPCEHWKAMLAALPDPPKGNENV